jgi:HD domain
MSLTISATAIPDSKLAKEAAAILREQGTDLLFNHSNRVYLFAAELGRQKKLRFDPELLYVSAAFHDLGLVKKYISETERFEVDGANAVRQFLTAHNLPEEQVQTAWTAIALHTTPGVTQYMKPIVAEYPRKNFKDGIVKAFFGGFEHKPGTTWGTVKADVCERFIPGYKSPNFCDLIANSPFPDSAAR